MVVRQVTIGYSSISETLVRYVVSSLRKGPSEIHFVSEWICRGFAVIVWEKMMRNKRLIRVLSSGININFIISSSTGPSTHQISNVDIFF